MCMPFCCDDCVYVNILTCLVSRNLDQGAQCYELGMIFFIICMFCFLG